MSTRLLRCFLAAGFFIAAMFCQEEPSPAQKLTFYAMGDTPYTVADFALLPKQIAAIRPDADFVVHVGDIKSGAIPCVEPVYTKVADMLRKCKLPVFVLPGDNEWNDCVSPENAWKLWNRHFLNFDTRWRHDIPVTRDATRPENFAFMRHGVLVVGVNLVGGRVHDQDEWKQRHRQNIDWLQKNLRRAGSQLKAVVLLGHADPRNKHDDFFKPLSQLAKASGKPFLYLHGDGHRWKKGTPFKAGNLLCVQIDQGGAAPPLKVTVTPSRKKPFDFDRQKKKD